MKKILIILLASLLISQVVAAQNSERTSLRRVVGNPDFVVFLMSDGSLDYYRVVESEGFYMGTTAAGWRNDALGQQLIDTVQEDHARAELWHLHDDLYYVAFFRDEVLIGSGNFSAADVPELIPPAVPEIEATPETETEAVVDSGLFFRASGSYDGTYYTVARGDNLFRIALRFGVGFSELRRLNNIPDPSQIYAGQRLLIPQN